ncbi:hypothetical protein J8L70_07755 [Pseudoalteromonas sp. MMG010]|uniref:hypothetical protein n=1 Tax=Pseudoalteromonas sp. MMG010 TaxID=2822685 RepID=UPI001B39FF4C|nr:hypothetical protein [Pseudoalteromonas sp. MMG010]MBQ4833131.1 hypothetical protein [Pseudoalteromonas sp. MMG010]
MKTLLTIFIILIFSTSVFAAIHAEQEIKFNDNSPHPFEDVTLANHLKAGDTLTIKLTGLTQAAVLSNNRFSTGKDGATQIFSINLDPEYFVATPTRNSFEFCEHNNQGCIQKSFIKIKNDGRFSTLDIIAHTTKNDAVNKVITDSTGKNIIFQDVVQQIEMIDKESGWSLSGSGGFIISGLTQNKFYIDESSNKVLRNTDAEDDISLGLAAFVHTCNETWSDAGWLILRPKCLTFGLGLSDQSNDFNFFPGISWRIGDELHLTLGAQLGKINTLPNGLKIGDTVESSNAINTLDSRYSGRVFLSISYTFLGDSDNNAFTGKFSSL